MRNLLKKILLWLLALIAFMVVFGLFLSFLPSPLKMNHKGISPEKAAELRTMYSDAHQIFTTFGLDYRGHGLSDGNRGDSPNKERWIADLTESVEHIKCLGFQRVIIVGHILGVAAAICVADAILEEIVEWMDSTY
jgi:hypothetical protein